MTDKEYGEFVVHYRQLRLGSMDFEFVLLWRKKLDRFTLANMKLSAEDVAADPTVGFPMNDLPLLLEYAMARDDEKRKVEQAKYFNHESKYATSREWDLKMLEFGAITKKEFSRRDKLRGVRVENLDGREVLAEKVVELSEDEIASLKKDGGQ